MNANFKQKHVKVKNSMTHVHGTPMAQITQAFAIIATAIKPIIVQMFHRQVLVRERAVYLRGKQLASINKGATSAHILEMKDTYELVIVQLIATIGLHDPYTVMSEGRMKKMNNI